MPPEYSERDLRGKQGATVPGTKNGSRWLTTKARLTHRTFVMVDEGGLNVVTRAYLCHTGFLCEANRCRNSGNVLVAASYHVGYPALLIGLLHGSVDDWQFIAGIFDELNSPNRPRTWLACAVRALQTLGELGAATTLAASRCSRSFRSVRSASRATRLPRRSRRRRPRLSYCSSRRALRTGSRQLDDMPHHLQLTRPVVRTAAGLHADQTYRRVREERCYLVTPKLLTQHRLFVPVDRRAQARRTALPSPGQRSESPLSVCDCVS